MTPEHAPSDARPQRLNPAAMSPADVARVLTRVGGSPVTEDMLRADINAGAPTNADGSINLVQYAAWLVQQMSAGGGRGE